MSYLDYENERSKHNRLYSMSPAFSITKEQVLSVVKGFVIAEAGAVLAVAATWLASGTVLDFHVLLALEGAAIGSTAVNFFRKFLPSN